MNPTTSWPTLAIVTLAVLFTLPVASRHTGAAHLQREDTAPVACALPSLSEDEVRAIIPTPSANNDVIQLPTALPAGEPVDEATETAIRDAIKVFYACANAGMPVETIALFSPRFLSQPGGLVEPDFSVTVTPVPDRERISMLDVWDIQSLPDGRVAATVAVGSDANDETDRTLIVLFVRVNDRWLIDELITAILRDDQRVMVADVVGSPPAATPDQ